MKYFLEFSYNGTRYHGWQKQPNSTTVQGVIEDCLSKKLQEEVNLQGAGRTDTGVHAKQMFAHFESDKIITRKMLKAFNAFLPNDIYIYNIHKMNPEAHARFDATSRTYFYDLSTEKVPFNRETITYVWSDLDFEKMNQAAKIILEYSDFTSFAKLHTGNKTNICKVTKAEWEYIGHCWRFTITADRFLRNMVRAIVGTLLDVGRNKITLEEFRTIIENKNRSLAGTSAFAKGLFLVDISYPKEIFNGEI